MPRIENLNHEEHEEKPARKEGRIQESRFRRKNPKSKIRNVRAHYSITPLLQKSMSVA
jgi:hypothetical protein